VFQSIALLGLHTYSFFTQTHAPDAAPSFLSSRRAEREHSPLPTDFFFLPCSWFFLSGYHPEPCLLSAFDPPVSFSFGLRSAVMSLNLPCPPRLVGGYLSLPFLFCRQSLPPLFICCVTKQYVSSAWRFSRGATCYSFLLQGPAAP